MALSDEQARVRVGPNPQEKITQVPIHSPFPWHKVGWELFATGGCGVGVGCSSKIGVCNANVRSNHGSSWSKMKFSSQSDNLHMTCCREKAG